MAWLTLQSLGSRAISLGSQLALAWLLSPTQFGAIGLVYAITGISGALVNFGLDNVLMQRHRAMPMWFAPTFWASLALGITGFAAVVVIASLGARIYGNPRIVGLAVVLAISMPIGALSTVPGVLIRSRMDFRFLSTYRLIEFAASQVATVALAATGFGAYSFVLPTPVIAAIGAAVQWAYAPAPVLRRFRRRQIRILFGSGLIIFAARLIIECITQGDYIILGLMASEVQVGAYYFAFRLAAQPIYIIAGNLIGVLQPALIQLKNDGPRQIEATMTVARLLAYVAFPACFLQGALADPLLRLFFATKWKGAIPVMSLLSVGLAFDAVTWATGTLLDARREFMLFLKLYAGFAPLFFIFIFIGAAAMKALGTAAGLTCFYLIMGPAMSCIVMRRYGVPVRTTLALSVRPPLLAAAAIGTAAALSYCPGLRALQLARIAEICLVGAGLYVALLRAFDAAVLDELLNRLIPGRLKPRLEGKVRGLLRLPAATV